MHYTPLASYSIPERPVLQEPVHAPMMSAMTAISPVTGELMVPGNAGVVIQSKSGDNAIRVGGTAMASNMTLAGANSTLNQIQFFSNGNIVSALDESGLYFPDSKGIYFGNAATFGALTYAASVTTLSAPTTINLKIGATNVASITSTGINGANLLSNATNGNLAVGANAFSFIGAGNYGTSIGVNSGNASMSGGSNTCVGYGTGLALTNGYQNTLIGSAAGNAITTGYANTIVGRAAGTAITSGYGNIIIGQLANVSVTTGYNNIYIGQNCVGSGVNNAGEIVIGEGATGRGNNTAQIGNIYTSTFGFGSDTAILNKIATTFNSNTINIQNGSANGTAYISLNYGSGIYFNNPANTNTWIMSANSSSQLVINNPSGGANQYLNNNSAAWINGSDRRLKENIKDIQNGIDIISQLQPVHYQYIKRSGDALHTGFIANDVKLVLPNAVHEIEDGMLGLEQMHIFPYAVQAIKELNEKIEKQSQLIALLMSKIESRQ
jgi:hypothetical protein